MTDLLSELRALADDWSQCAKALRREVARGVGVRQSLSEKADRAEMLELHSDRVLRIIARREQPDRTDETAARERLGRWLAEKPGRTWSSLCEQGQTWVTVACMQHAERGWHAWAPTLAQAIHDALDKAGAD